MNWPKCGCACVDLFQSSVKLVLARKCEDDIKSIQIGTLAFVGAEQRVISIFEDYWLGPDLLKSISCMPDTFLELQEETN